MGRNILVASYPRSGTHLAIHLIAQALGCEPKYFDIPVFGSPTLTGATLSTLAEIQDGMDFLRREEVAQEETLVWKTHHGAEIFRPGRVWPSVVYCYRDPMDTLFSHWVFLHRRYELVNVSFEDFCLNIDPLDLTRGSWFSLEPKPKNSIERLHYHRKGWWRLAQGQSMVYCLSYDNLVRNPARESEPLADYVCGWPHSMGLPEKLVGITPWAGKPGAAIRYLPLDTYAKVWEAYKNLTYRDSIEVDLP